MTLDSGTPQPPATPYGIPSPATSRRPRVGHPITAAPAYPQKDTASTPVRPLRRGSAPLADLEPEISREWDYDANGEWTPETIAQKSNLYAYWVCADGHRWRARINNRVAGRTGCPDCYLAQEEGAKPRDRKDSFAATHPTLTRQWHPTRNRRTPEQVTATSTAPIWWECHRGHTWQATPHSRATTRNGCPKCPKTQSRRAVDERSIAFTSPTKARLWHPTKNGDLTPASVRPGSARELWWQCPDCSYEWHTSAGRIYGCPACAGRVVVPGFNDLASRRPEIAAQWHPTKNGDLTPDQITARADRPVWWLCACGNEHQAHVSNKGPHCHNCFTLKAPPSKYGPLSEERPEVAAMWHPTKNGDLTPSDISDRSTERVWWLCPNGHETQAKVKTKSSGCLECRPSLRAAPRGTVVIAPEIASQWHPTKNGTKQPSDFTANSGETVWWLCGCGHEFEGIIRYRRSTRCIRCTPNRAKRPVTDAAKPKRTRNDSISLATSHPALAAEWHPTENGDLTPNDIVVGGRAEPWWLCPNGHSYKMRVRRRRDGVGCQQCIEDERTAGATLAKRAPAAANRWHPTKNGSVTPETVLANSTESAWWIGECGHEWEQPIYLAAVARVGCHVCTSKTVLPGHNDLASQVPHVAAQWHPTKNGDKTPEMFAPGSKKSAWWLCNDCGFEWEARINDRTARGGATACKGPAVHSRTTLNKNRKKSRRPKAA